ncbi:MAG: sulfite exporter TauE/SafE family protein [bacterium]|jgi:uncharacterized membrane protein YfcA
MTDSPEFYLVATVAILIVGISKGGFGGGLGTMGVPLLALVISPVQAAAILLPILCTMDLIGLWKYWRQWDVPTLAICIPGSFIGMVVATFTFSLLDPNAIRLLIGGITVVFTLDYWFRPKQVGSAPPGRNSGYFWSSISGFTSFVAHAGSPPLSVYLLPQRLEKTTYVATTVVFFIFVNYVKLVPYAALGLFPEVNLMTSLFLLPLAPIGTLLGIWMHHRVSEVWFYRICYVLLFITGLKLVWDGAWGVWEGGLT